jgi:NADPH:quinone reductase-like Zn-dependent oxidoreductase
MRAVYIDGFSPSLDVYRIGGLPLPGPGPGYVRVRVAYAALNRLDDWVRQGWKGLDIAFPHVPCSDFAGVISALGEGVTGWDPGEWVTANPMLSCDHCPACLCGEENRCTEGQILGEQIQGACAEFVVVPAANLVRIPAGYDVRKAAAASLVYSTAWHSIVTLGRVRRGDKVLIVGAGGGVNTASLQIALLMGAEAYVIAGDHSKAERALAMGAKWAHNRAAPNGDEWARAVFEATDRTGIDIVVDNVGEPTWQRSLRTLRTNGRLLTVGGTGGYAATVPVNLIFGRHLSILGSTMGTRQDYTDVMAQVFAGRLDPVVDSVFPMEAFPAAIARLVANEHFGKILIGVNGFPD